MNRRTWALAAVAVAAVGGGCSSINDARGRGDAPISKRDDSPAYVINMPDQFMNVAHKCYGVNGIYAHTRQAAPIIVPNDPMCKKNETAG